MMTLRDKEFERDLIANEIVGVMRALVKDSRLEPELRALVREKLASWDQANEAIRKLRQTEWQ